MTTLKKHRALIAGTLLLTAAGFLTRILGFFYRIFLSRTIGAEGLGLYHMVHPIYGICFALCAGSIQTAISRFVAAETSRDRTNSRAVFGTGLFISLSLSLMLTAVLIRFSGPIAQFILMEERCSHLLPYMALSVPLSSIHACINGYYYGLQKTKVPAAAQVAEQTIRMGAVFLIARILLSEGRTITVELAAAGHLIGELASCLFTVFCFSFSNSPSRQKNAFLSSFASTAPPLMALALPLMGNRLVLNLLSSAEAIWIPSCLQESGLTSQEAFSVYGVLTGMAMPFSICHHQFHGRCPSPLSGRSPGGRKRKPHRPDHLPLSAVQPLYGRSVHRRLHPVWPKPWNQRLSGHFLRNLYAGAGLALSLSLSCHYHGKYLKRPGTDLRHLFPKCGRPSSAAGLCTSWHSPLWHPCLALRPFIQRDPAGGPPPDLLKTAGGFFLGTLGNHSEAGPCPASFRRYSFLPLTGLGRFFKTASFSLHCASGRHLKPSVRRPFTGIKKTGIKRTKKGPGKRIFDHAPSQTLFLCESMHNYSSSFLSSSPLLEDRYAGGISKIVLPPFMPSRFMR